MIQPVKNFNEIEILKYKLENFKLISGSNPNPFQLGITGERTLTSLAWDDIMRREIESKQELTSELRIKEEIEDLLERSIIEEESEISETETIAIKKGSIIEPDFYYLKYICNLPNVISVISESVGDAKHLMTILSERDIATRERIYDIEMQIFEQYPGGKFEFSTVFFTNSKELASLIKGKRILFFKESGYANEKRTSEDY